MSCGYKFTRDDFKDLTGCILEEGHVGPHICETWLHGFVSWEYDFECGCPDCCTDDFDDMCIVYQTDLDNPLKNT